MANSIIALEGMEFHAHHGVYPEERKTGRTFIVDVYLEVDTSNAAITDELNDTVDYADVFEIVKQIMETPLNLLEHVVEKILVTVLNHSARVQEVKVRVSKMDPPLPGKVVRTYVESIRHRNEISVELS